MSVTAARDPHADETGHEGPTTAAEELARRSHTVTQRVQHFVQDHPSISPALILVITGIVFNLVNSRFLTQTTISLLLQQAAVVAALAVGQTIVILTAGIDLSVGAIAILSAMVMAKVSSDHGVPGVAALAIGIVVAALAGTLNGVLVTRREAAAVHRHPRHAQHLHRARPALHQGPQRAGVGDAGAVELDRQRRCRSARSASPPAC